MSKVPQHYIPNFLSQKEKNTLKRELKKSRKMYKKNKYYTRKKVPGYKNKKTSWEKRLRKKYSIPENKSLNTRFLAKKTKCSVSSLKKIIKKGMGAYYSSGSRPNQTPFSWGNTRLYSALSGGPASKTDYSILKDGCKSKSKALRLARKSQKNTKRKQISLDGGARMKEKIVKIIKSPRQFKKYRAYLKNNKTKKERHIDFGDNRYQQYKDRTPLKIYKSGDHNDSKRMGRYFRRHSGTTNRSKAIQHEKSKSNHMYNAKILSHQFLW
jgi:hypothetical protein